MTWSHAFSRAWRRLHAFTSNSDWSIVLFTCVLIGQSNYSGTPLYGHPLNTDTRILRTVSLVPTRKSSYIFSGAHNPERSTPTYSCNGVFTDLSIFRLKFPQIQSPRGASLTSLMLCIILM